MPRDLRFPKVPVPSGHEFWSGHEFSSGSARMLREHKRCRGAESHYYVAGTRGTHRQVSSNRYPGHRINPQFQFPILRVSNAVKEMNEFSRCCLIRAILGMA